MQTGYQLNQKRRKERYQNFLFKCLETYIIYGYHLILRYQGVSIGGGIGSISDILDAAQLICDKVLSHIILSLPY